MSKLFQIQLFDGTIYATRESNEEEFFKQKIYRLKKGCVVRNVVLQNRQPSIQIFDISKNTYFGLPITIQTSCIVDVKPIKKGSELEALYVKITSDIVVLN